MPKRLWRTGWRIRLRQRASTVVKALWRTGLRTGGQASGQGARLLRPRQTPLPWLTPVQSRCFAGRELGRRGTDTQERLKKFCGRLAGGGRGGLFEFWLRFDSVAGHCGHAPSPKPRQNPKILAPNGYRISLITLPGCRMWRFHPCPSLPRKAKG